MLPPVSLGTVSLFRISRHHAVDYLLIVLDNELVRIFTLSLASCVRWKRMLGASFLVILVTLTRTSRLVGPILLGCQAAPRFTPDNGGVDWKTLATHRDEGQVELDVNRSFVFYPQGMFRMA